MQGELVSSVNVNHPLPICWNVKLDKLKRTRKNILFALKLVELIYRRYKKQLLFEEEKLINFNNFLTKLVNEPKQPKLPKIHNKKKQILLMKDEYEPRDLQFEKVKNIYENELKGPSLKKMDANKRVQIIQQVWHKNEGYQEIEPDLDQEEIKAKINEIRNKQEEECNEKGKDCLTYFEPEYRRAMFSSSNNKIDSLCKKTFMFSKKLDQSVKKSDNLHSDYLLDPETINEHSFKQSRRQSKVRNPPRLSQQQYQQIVMPNLTGRSKRGDLTFYEYASQQNLTTTNFFTSRQKSIPKSFQQTSESQ
eukprot:TRINITY_DN11241_c0_g1_i2.p1 TRINITY_DN11241_c0_g1~~TRINITY_DN11241_c0_g1_i2.p1  ORF type:complete len:306 (+),score=28.88 TRINITY_DN11241_c0_g1_i2:84-1001(+)